MVRTVRILIYLTAFAVGAVLLGCNSYAAFSAIVQRYLATSNGFLVSSGIALLFLLGPLMMLAAWWQVFRRARDISYTTENGKISVSLIAIEEALTRAIEGESEVKKATVRVLEDRLKRSIVIEAVVTLWEVANVTERNRFCQRLLRRRFAELMPEQTVVQVNLTIHRLNQRRVEAKPPSALAAAPVPVPPVVQTPADASDQRPAAGALPAASIPAEGSESEPAQPGDEDLYVGPTYPVLRDDEEDGGGSHGYVAVARSTPTVPPIIQRGSARP
jgi:hypothetical protein